MTHLFRYPRPDPRKVPTVPVRLELSHQLAQSLVGCWMPGVTGGRDYSIQGNSGGVYAGAPVIAGSPIGPSMYFAGNTVNTALSIADSTSLQPSGDFAVGVLLQTSQSGTSNQYPCPISKDYSGASRNAYNILTWVNGANSNAWAFSMLVGGTNSIVYGNSGSVRDGKPHFLIGARGGSTQYTYQNGALQNTGTAVTGTVAGGGPLTIGTDYYNASISTKYDGNIMLAFVMLRNPPAGQVEWLNAEPFAMFEPIVRRTFVGLVSPPPPPRNDGPMISQIM